MQLSAEYIKETESARRMFFSIMALWILLCLAANDTQEEEVCRPHITLTTQASSTNSPRDFSPCPVTEET